MNKRLNLFLLFLLAMLAIPWSKAYAISDKTQLISNDCGFKVDTGRHEYIEFEIADVYPTFYGTRNWDHSRHIISIKSKLIGYSGPSDSGGTALKEIEYNGDLDDHEGKVLEVPWFGDYRKYHHYKATLSIDDNAGNHENTCFYFYRDMAVPKHGSLMLRNARYYDAMQNIYWYRGGDNFTAVSCSYMDPLRSRYRGCSVNPNTVDMVRHGFGFNRNNELYSKGRAHPTGYFHEGWATWARDGGGAQVGNFSFTNNPSVSSDSFRGMANGQVTFNCTFKRQGEYLFYVQRNCVLRVNSLKQAFGNNLFISNDYDNAGIRAGTDNTPPEYARRQLFKMKDKVISSLVEGIRDYRSGLDTSSLEIVYSAADGSVSNVSESISCSRNGGFKHDFDITGTSLDGYSGNINITVYASDKVGNRGIVAKGSTFLDGGNIYCDKINVIGSPYSDSRGYWFKTNNKFALDAKAGVNPVSSDKRINVLNIKAYTINSTRLRLDDFVKLPKTQDSSTDIVPRCTTSDIKTNIGRGYARRNNSNNTLSLRDSCVFERDDVHLDAYPSAKCFEDNGKLYKETSERDESLKVRLNSDGKAPEVFKVKELDDHNVEFEVGDNRGSGIAHLIIYRNGTIVYDEKCTNTTDNISACADLEVGNNDVRVWAIDNVGNLLDTTYHFKSPLPTGIITLDMVLHNARNMLSANAQASGQHSFMVWDVYHFRQLDETNKETGQCYINPPKELKSTTGTMDYTEYLDDKVNTIHPTTFKYETNDLTAKLSWRHMEDVFVHYKFDLTYEHHWKVRHRSCSTGSDGKRSCSTWYSHHQRNGTLDTKEIDYRSGFDHYTYTITRLTNEDGQAVNAVAMKGETKDDFLNIERLQPGDYHVSLYMWDKNGNPSVESVYDFHIDGVFKFLRPNIEITAVKDPRWIKAPYPFIYDLSLLDDNFSKINPQFPLGSAYKFDGSDIKGGYGVNIQLDRWRMKEATSIDILYHYMSDDGRELDILKDGEDISNADGVKDLEGNTIYLKRYHADFSTTERTKIIKHFIPVPESIEVRYQDNKNIYRGNITVKAELTLNKNTVKSESYTIPLYTENMSKSALNDLRLDKQR